MKNIIIGIICILAIALFFSVTRDNDADANKVAALQSSAEKAHPQPTQGGDMTDVPLNPLSKEAIAQGL